MGNLVKFNANFREHLEICLVLVVLGMEHKASHVLGKHSSAKLHLPQPSFKILF